VTAAAATSVTAENRPHRALSARTTMLVLIHRRKCFLTNGLFLSYPVEKSWLFLSTGERVFLPMDYFLHTFVETMVVFYPPEKVLFYQWIISFITSWKRWLFLATGERSFYHWISFVTSSKGWLFLSTGERAFSQWFELHTSSNPEVNGRIRPENPESSANSVAAPHLVN
jgi:hypothetical protein